MGPLGHAGPSPARRSSVRWPGRRDNVASPEPRSELTIALTVRQFAVVGAVVAVVLTVLIQGRRWRAR